MPSQISSKGYKQFIEERLEEQRIKFYKKIHQTGYEQKYSGLYSLLRLAQDPDNLEIEDAIDKHIEFIGK